MITDIILDIILNVLQLIILVVGIISSLRLKVSEKGYIFRAFFTFGMISLALDDIYWIVYEVLRPEQRMPFAGNEVAASAMILLFASALTRILPKTERVSKGILVITLVFMLPVVALWTAWSGAFIENLVCGIPYMYFLYIILLGVRKYEIADIRKGIVIAVLCAFVIILNIASLVFREMAHILDTFNYTIVNMMTLYFLIRCIHLLKYDVSGRRSIVLSFILFFHTCNVMYMSGGFAYNLALFMNILSLPVMFLSVKKEYVHAVC